MGHRLQTKRSSPLHACATWLSLSTSILAGKPPFCFWMLTAEKRHAPTHPAGRLLPASAGSSGPAPLRPGRPRVPAPWPGGGAKARLSTDWPARTSGGRRKRPGGAGPVTDPRAGWRAGGRTGWGPAWGRCSAASACAWRSSSCRRARPTSASARWASAAWQSSAT